jgi:hypothetical protein
MGKHAPLRNNTSKPRSKFRPHCPNHKERNRWIHMLVYTFRNYVP